MKRSFELKYFGKNVLKTFCVTFINCTWLAFSCKKIKTFLSSLCFIAVGINWVLFQLNCFACIVDASYCNHSLFDHSLIVIRFAIFYVRNQNYEQEKLFKQLISILNVYNNSRQVIITFAIGD
jgi:hypothetical protein